MFKASSNIVGLVLILLVVLARAEITASGPAVALDSPTWELINSKNEITLYCSEVKGTGIVPVKAVMTIPGTIEEVSAVLEDISRRGEWIDHFGQSRLLKWEGNYRQTEYLRMNMPWPVTDRTTLVQVDITVSPDRKTATITGKSVDCCQPEDLPVNVRAHVYESTFQMTQAGDKVEVVSLIFIDPGGWLPIWVVNLYTRKVSYRTLAGLRRQVAKNLYSPGQLADLTRRIQEYQLGR